MYEQTYARADFKYGFPDGKIIRFFSYTGYTRFLEQAGFKPCRWFRDFGHLAHYLNPDMWIEPQEWKKEQGIPRSKRARIALRFLKRGWRLFNVFVLLDDRSPAGTADAVGEG